MAMSSAINSLYLRNAFIISNLTNHFNVLDPKDEESIIKKTVDLYIINPVSEIGIYQSKKYTSNTHKVSSRRPFTTDKNNFTTV